MGNLTHSTCVNADETVKQVLQGELLSLLDSLSELFVVSADSRVLWGLSMPIISGVAGVGDAGWDPEGNSMSIGATLGVRDGLFMVVKCWSSYLTHGREALAEDFEDLGILVGFGMQLGGCMEGWGRYFLGWNTDLKWVMDLGCNWELLPRVWVWRVAVVGHCQQVGWCG